jgi:hypothetical protein
MKARHYKGESQPIRPPKTGKVPIVSEIDYAHGIRDRLELVMIEEAIDEKELAFLKQLEEHEDEWVAFIEDHGAEIVVGNGRDAVEALKEAEKRGFPDAILMKVPQFDRGFIPANFSSVRDVTDLNSPALTVKSNLNVFKKTRLTQNRMNAV